MSTMTQTPHPILGSPTEVTTGDHALVLRYDRPVDRDTARRAVLAAIESPNPDEYNGWPNRETWAASLLFNDYGLYTMVNNWAIDAHREATADAERDEFGHYAGGFASIEATTIRNLADALRSYIEELRYDITDDLGDRASKTERMMVLEIGSYWRVDWFRLAENWLLDGLDFDDE